MTNSIVRFGVDRLPNVTAQLVRELYTAHDAGNGPFSVPPDRTRIDIFFTRRLGRPGVERGE